MAEPGLTRTPRHSCSINVSIRTVINRIKELPKGINSIKIYRICRLPIYSFNLDKPVLKCKPF